MQKKGGLFSGVIAGIVLLIVGTVLLWWNEGNNVKNIKATDEVEKKVVDVSSESVDPANDGKLVCTSGSMTVADESVSDGLFAVGTKTAILRRVVEVYQYEETDTSDGDTTSYSYSAKWSENLIDSSTFHDSGYRDKNPASKPYESDSFTASGVSVGAYRLSSEQIENLPSDKALETITAAAEGYKVSGAYLTNAENIASPIVGDVRISWVYNDWSEATVLAQTSGDSFVTYTAENGKTFNRVEGGIHTAKEMVQMLRDENNAMKWLFRGLGALAILIGYISVFSLLTRLLSYIPLIGGLVNGALFVVEFLAAIAHSLIVISIAWIVFRPVLGIALLAASAALIIVQVRFAKKKKAEA